MHLLTLFRCIIYCYFPPFQVSDRQLSSVEFSSAVNSNENDGAGLWAALPPLSSASCIARGYSVLSLFIFSRFCFFGASAEPQRSASMSASNSN